VYLERFQRFPDTTGRAPLSASFPPQRPKLLSIEKSKQNGNSLYFSGGPGVKGR